MKVAAHESLTGLYRKIVLDHSRHPHHFGRMENCQHVATGHNPLCGDKITLYIKMDGDFIADGTFEASACAICMASASMMMDAIHGQGQAAARSLVHDFLGMFDRPRVPDRGVNWPRCPACSISPRGSAAPPCPGRH